MRLIERIGDIFDIIIGRNPAKNMNDKNIFFQDQAEWYIVCNSCFVVNQRFQWSGSTKVNDFQTYFNETIVPTLGEAKRCSFCNKKFGGKPNLETGKSQYSGGACF